MLELALDQGFENTVLEERLNLAVDGVKLLNKRRLNAARHSGHKARWLAPSNGDEKEALLYVVMP